MKRKLAILLAIAMIGLTACGTENTSVETTVAETITATETTVETEAITTTEATITTTAEAVTTMAVETEATTVEELNYNTAYVETAEKLFYALEGSNNTITSNIKIYADDINDDGVLELFCCKSETGMGFTDMHIFDVTTGNTSTFWIGQTNKGILNM